MEKHSAAGAITPDCRQIARHLFGAKRISDQLLDGDGFHGAYAGFQNAGAVPPAAEADLRRVIVGVTVTSEARTEPENSHADAGNRGRFVMPIAEQETGSASPVSTLEPSEIAREGSIY